MTPRSNHPMKPAGIYLSVPFCRQKCTYCNFASDVFPASLLPRYLRALESEITHHGELWQRAGLPRHDAVSVDTIYLGGGTPGLLDGGQLGKLLTAVRTAFSMESVPEITLEASPENITQLNAEGWAACGVNRISMGTQSMVTQELRAVGRLHDEITVGQAFATLRQAGITNISADLIAGLPYQTEQSWAQTLHALVDLEPTHISVYMLEVDEDSRLGKEILSGGSRYAAEAVPSEEQIAASYTHAAEQLRSAGFHHYEISNFSLPGRESRHNEKYWTDAPYFGFGVDAHSYDGERRWANTDNLTDYLESVEQGQPPIPQWRKLEEQEKLEERFYLGLRRRQGISLPELSAQFGFPVRPRYEEKIREFSDAGWLAEEQDRLRLTDAGLLFSNEVFAAFLA